MAITPGGRVGDATPLGHKGGPRQLDDYVREVAHALMRKGYSESHAIAVAKNSLKRWRRGGGKVRPQVRAGAAAHLGIQQELDKRRGSGLNLSVPIGASYQDGGRGTMATMAATATKKRKKIRPGSIPAGKGKGKFPITDQKSVRSAASLLSKAKGVSKATIVAHVRAEAKARGLKLTPAFKGDIQDHSNPQRGALEAAVTDRLRTLDLTVAVAPDGQVDLVGPKGYSHGWVRGEQSMGANAHRSMQKAAQLRKMAAQTSNPTHRKKFSNSAWKHEKRVADLGFANSLPKASPHHPSNLPVGKTPPAQRG